MGCVLTPEKCRISTMADESVKLIGYWASPFALRVEWALKLKGIEYDYLEEDLPNKSPLLLQSNPVYKQLPVLIHGRRPLAESLLILEYIDETWKQTPLLPDHPLDRAKARFWAKFADDKCVPAILGVFSKKGDAQAEAAKEARENLKSLESGLEGKLLFGGEKIGFVDVAAGWMAVWVPIVEEITGVSLIDSEKMSLLSAWIQHFLENPIIKERLPDRAKLLEHNKNFQKARAATQSPS